MNCAAARVRIAAEPGAGSAELEAHLCACTACEQFRREMRELEARIARACALGPPLPRAPDARGSRTSRTVTPIAAAPRRAAPAVWRPWALAATLLLATGTTAVLWLLRPADTLAHEVVVHVRAEPASWLASRQVSAAGIERALRANGVQLGINSDRITYAQSCWFRGHYVPHLVVQTGAGPATVLILKYEQVRAAQRFSERGLSGIIVPAPQSGSIAVVMQGGAARAGAAGVAGQMHDELQWLAAAR